MTLFQDRHGVVSIDGHRLYLEAIEREDERLESSMAEIRSRRDSGQLGAAESAVERVNALESHLAECQRLRRLYLGGS
jgi:hypothetical protein